MTTGTCLCGTVRYRVDAPFRSMLNCHCSMCRKHHGAPFVTFAAAPLTAFAWLAGQDNLRHYQSSEHGVRSYCTTCGSVAPTLFEAMDLAVCPAGNLEQDPGIRPQAHMFVASKAAWYTITDALPQHPVAAPELGGYEGIARPGVTPRPGIAEGSCLCGEVAYELTGPLLRMMNCHCSRCRRARGGAHTTNLFVSLDGFRWTRGESLVAGYKVPEAVRFGVAFCTRCGGKVPRVARDYNWAVVPAAALDTDPGMRPQAHIFVGSKAPWYEITDSLPQFDGPPS